MTETSLSPIPMQARIEALDAIRGFALLGIFLMNIEWFSRPLDEFGYGLPAGLAGLDFAVAWCVYVFVQGKFWILFSLLFGMGFAVMSERAQAAGRAFAPAYLRRTAALFAFGVAHAVLLWPGDILHSYAIAALLLFGVSSFGDRVLWMFGGGLYSAIAGLTLLIGAALAFVPPDQLAALMGDDAAQVRAAAAEAARIYAEGGYAAVTLQRLRDFGDMLTFDIAVVPSAFAVFMLGAWLVRSGRMRDVGAHRGFFSRLLIWALPVGLGLTLCSAWIGVRFPVGETSGRWMVASGLQMLGALPLSLAYLAALALGLGRVSTPRWAGWLAPAGRMALTNYLMQSLIASTLFYGYGVGLWGDLGRAAQTALVFAIFAAQLLLSRWWLSRHRFGPMEWLWRWITYAQRPTMRLAR